VHLHLSSSSSGLSRSRLGGSSTSSNGSSRASSSDLITAADTADLPQQHSSSSNDDERAAEAGEQQQLLQETDSLGADSTSPTDAPTVGSGSSSSSSMVDEPSSGVDQQRQDVDELSSNGKAEQPNSTLAAAAPKPKEYRYIKEVAALNVMKAVYSAAAAAAVDFADHLTF
jgi:hypothetical protein